MTPELSLFLMLTLAMTEVPTNQCFASEVFEDYYIASMTEQVCPATEYAQISCDSCKNLVLDVQSALNSTNVQREVTQIFVNYCPQEPLVYELCSNILSYWVHLAINDFLVAEPVEVCGLIGVC